MATAKKAELRFVSPAAKGFIKEGMKAPSFSGVDQTGKKISLANFKGQKLALYFYSEDMSPTCTVQACSLRDGFTALNNKKIQIVGVSPDTVESHKKFAEKYKLPFPLLADPNHIILKKYGVWGEKQMFGNQYMGVHRTTFLIDEKGVIRKIIFRPLNKDHATEIIRFFEN